MQTGKTELDKLIESWRPLIEGTNAAVSIHDTKYRIILANERFRSLCGKHGAEGETCYKIIHCIDGPHEFCPMKTAMAALQDTHAEFYEPTLDKHLSVYASPIVINGTLLGAIHTIVDVSEAKAAKKEMDKNRDAFLNMLEDVTDAYEELQELFMGIVMAMISALDAKSHWTNGHSERVAMYAMQIADALGLDDDMKKDINLAALLHDIGKIGTYDTIIDKPSKLTDEEFAIVKKHPAQGAEFLGSIKQLRNIIPIIRHHHERMDGRGYPDGLKGEDIPFGARILHVADTFDAIMADRPYRPSPGLEHAINEFRKFAGVQFDPQVAGAFLKIIEKKS